MNGTDTYRRLSRRSLGIVGMLLALGIHAGVGDTIFPPLSSDVIWAWAQSKGYVAYSASPPKVTMHSGLETEDGRTAAGIAHSGRRLYPDSPSKDHEISISSKGVHERNEAAIQDRVNALANKKSITANEVMNLPKGLGATNVHPTVLPHEVFHVVSFESYPTWVKTGSKTDKEGYAILMSFVYYNEKLVPQNKRLTLEQFLVSYFGKERHEYKDYANAFVLKYRLDARAITGDVIHKILSRLENELSAGIVNSAALSPKPKPPAPVSPANTRTGLQDGDINQQPRQRFGDLDYQQTPKKHQSLFGDTLR